MQNPYPCTSVVYGEEPHEYISTVLSVKNMIDEKEALNALEFYMNNQGLDYGIHMIAFVRNYAEKVAKNKKVKS